MRNVAPARPGTAASQKRRLASNRKPMAGRFTTTTLQTIQTAKARNSAGMEIQRFRVATDFPSRSQKSLSSGSHTVNTRDFIRSLLLSSFPCPGRPPAIKNGRVLDKRDRQKEQVNQLRERRHGDNQERPRGVQLERH